MIGASKYIDDDEIIAIKNTFSLHPTKIHSTQTDRTQVYSFQFDTIWHHSTPYIWCQDTETTSFNTRGEEPSGVVREICDVSFQGKIPERIRILEKNSMDRKNSEER